MIKSGGIYGDLIAAISQVMFLAGKEALKKGISLAPNLTPKLAEKTTEYYNNRGINELNKNFTSSKASGITQTNNEIKDIMKVITCLENRGILLKRSTIKITNQKAGFLNLLRPLMTAGLPFVKNVPTP